MASSRLRFGSFELDLDSEELRRDGASVRLAPQPFKVLATLALRSGTVVSRDELQKSVWRDGVHVDFQGSLHSCIKQIRAALGDDSQEPRFIETLPRKGYRFLPEVAFSRTEARSRAAWPVVAGLGALVLLGASLAARFRESPDRAPSVTLLVLPFVNGTGDADRDYLGRALADETRARLSELDPEKLLVLAPETSDRYEDARTPPASDYILEGRLVDNDGRTGVEISLVRLRDGARVWEDRIGERDSVDPLVAALVPRLVAETEDRPTSPAEDLYFKGRYLLNSPERDGLERSLDYFGEALALEPDFVPAHVGLAEARLFRAMASGDRDDYAAAESAAREALALAPSADAQFVLALSRWFGAWDWEEAGRAFQRAILESPGLARAHHWYAYYLTGLGRHREAIFEIERARKLDPLSPQVRSDVGWFYYFAGRYDEAVAASLETLELEPDFPLARDCLIESRLALGDEVAALEAARAFDEPSSLEELWRARFDRAVVESGSRRPDGYEAAAAAIRLGEKREALEWLRRAAEERSLWMPMLGVDPRFNPIRETPELEALRRSIGLPRATARNEPS